MLLAVKSLGVVPSANDTGTESFAKLSIMVNAPFSMVVFSSSFYYIASNL